MPDRRSAQQELVRSTMSRPANVPRAPSSPRPGAGAKKL